MKNQLTHALTCYALVFACALAGTQTASAQNCQRGGIFARMFTAQRFQYAYSCRYAVPFGSCRAYNGNRCSSCSSDTQAVSEDRSDCQTCSGGSCAVQGDSAGNELSEIEKELVQEAIRVRGKILTIDRVCCQRSRSNSNAQAAACRLGHYTGDSNEIAGVGYGSAKAAIQGWLNSPPHRAILLRANYTKVGASVRRGSDGLLYWTMNFGY